jgi:hypothetical protein
MKTAAGRKRAQDIAKLARATKSRKRKDRTALRVAELETAQAILKDVGLEASPFAKRIARRLADVEVEVSILTEYVDGPHGRFTLEARKPTRAYSMLLDLLGKDRAELRQMLDRFAEASKGTASIAAGPLSITIGSAESIEIGPPGACATCGRQAPSGGDLPAGPTVPAPVEPDAVQRPVAPRTVEEVFRAEPVPVVVAPAESRRHRGFKGFAKDEVEDVPGDPGSIQW